MPLPNREVDDRSSLAAATFLGIVGSFVLLILPVFIGTLIEYRGFSNAQAGWIGSADLIGFALASVVAFRTVRSYSWRVIVVCGLLMIIIGDLTSILISVPEWLFLIRLALSGFGAGLVIAVPYTLLGDTQRPERNTGIYFSFNVLAGAVGLYTIPLVVARFGAPGMFSFLAMTGLIAIPITVYWLPTSGKIKRREEDSSSGLFSTSILFILAGIALYNFGLGGVWAFMERIGVEWGLQAERIGQILSATYLISMVGSATAAWQADRFGFLRPYTLGIGLMCLALALLINGGGYVMYAASLGLVNFAWNYSLTYQFSAVYRTDSTGRMAVFIIMVQAFGLMLGPGVAGSISNAGGYEGSLLLGIAACIGSLLLFYAARSASRRN